MAVISNTFKTYEAKGIREDLSNVIYDISPEETPYMSSAGRDKASNTLFEWQTDSLAAADTANKQLEGDDVASFDAVDPTVRLGNHTQISRKTLIISGTEQVVDKAGRKSERAYQIAKKSSELKRDMESILLSNQAAAAGAAATARATGSVLAFVKTNTDKGTGGVDPVYTTLPNATRTDGTQRVWTEAMLKNVISLCWTAGATPKVVMVGAFNKQKASSFAGIATQTYSLERPKVSAIVAAADVYVSDFGTLSIIPNRFQRARDAHVIDFEHVKVAYLRKFRTEELAKTGDAEKAMLLVEYGLKITNEKAHGLVADLTTV